MARAGARRYNNLMMRRASREGGTEVQDLRTPLTPVVLAVSVNGAGERTWEIAAPRTAHCARTQTAFILISCAACTLE